MNSIAELTLQKLEELEKEFQKFKDNLANTQSEKLKNTVAFLEKYTGNTAFQYWVLMHLNRQDMLSHQQNLAFRIQALEDEINWLKGCGYEVIQERDELINWVKEKPFYLTMSEKQFEMFLSMVEASGLDIGFSIKNMDNLVRIEFDERNADRVYHALSSFINEHELPETVVQSIKEVS